MDIACSMWQEQRSPDGEVGPYHERLPVPFLSSWAVPESKGLKQSDLGFHEVFTQPAVPSFSLFFLVSVYFCFLFACLFFVMLFGFSVLG